MSEVTRVGGGGCHLCDAMYEAASKCPFLRGRRGVGQKIPKFA